MFHHLYANTSECYMKWRYHQSIYYTEYVICGVIHRQPSINRILLTCLDGGANVSVAYCLY